MAVQNSIVIVNYNKSALLRRLLAALKLPESTACEVIVVDSASPDDSVTMLQREYPTIRIVEREYNRGFAVAVNRGIRQAVGDVIVVCHSDIVTDVHVLSELADRVREGSGRRVVAAMPRLIGDDGDEQPFVARLPRLSRSLAGTIHPQSARRAYLPYLDHVADHEFANLACIALSADYLHAQGGLDERFFLYFADADLAQRIHERSYRMLIASDLSVIHTGRSLGDDVPPHLARIMRKDLLRYVEKHLPGWQQGIVHASETFHRWIRKDSSESVSNDRTATTHK